MLRAQYRLSAGNCIGHAQVSVSPRSGRVGYHTDWADSFPYRSMGLPDNYGLPPASIQLFGFELDEPLRGMSIEQGALLAETLVQREALSLRTSLTDHRARLRARWREALSLAAKAGLEERKGS
jgi:hypothetical protein